MKDIYLQLYSLGQEASRTWRENFRIVSEMGYAGVEFAGSNYGGPLRGGDESCPGQV